MDGAKRAVEAAGWDLPWGADADHLKTLEDLAPFAEAGYTLFTVNPGGYVDNMAGTDSADVLSQKIRKVEWDELSVLYLRGIGEWVWGQFEPETLRRAIVKYGRVIQHTVAMFNRLSQMKDEFDFEVSVDETDSPTTPLEHFFIANELTRLSVRFTSRTSSIGD